MAKYDLVSKNGTIVDKVRTLVFCRDSRIRRGKMVAVDKVQGERNARYRRAGQLIAPKLMTIRKYVLGVIGLQ